MRKTLRTATGKNISFEVFFFWCLSRLIELDEDDVQTFIIDLATQAGYSQPINCKRNVDFSNTGKVNSGKGSRSMHVNHHELKKAESVQSHGSWRMGITGLELYPGYLARDPQRFRKYATCVLGRAGR